MNNIKILVVEDQIDENEILCEFLKNIDEISTVDSSFDGFQAVELMNFKNYDLIILDLVMQNMDGLELLDFIKYKSKKYDSKIIVTSAIGNSKIIKKAFDYGIDYYFKKSFNFKNLKSVIFDILSDKSDNNSFPYSVSEFVEKVGIPINLLGFNYIVDILKIILKDNSIKITQTYKLVSEKYSTSLQCVEANVRSAISCSHKLKNSFYKYLFESYQDKKPKNSIFLNTMVNFFKYGGNYYE